MCAGSGTERIPGAADRWFVVACENFEGTGVVEDGDGDPKHPVDRDRLDTNRSGCSLGGTGRRPHDAQPRSHMDGHQFDDLARVLAARAPRRAVLTALLGFAGGALGMGAANPAGAQSEPAACGWSVACWRARWRVLAAAKGRAALAEAQVAGELASQLPDPAVLLGGDDGLATEERQRRRRRRGGDGSGGGGGERRPASDEGVCDLRPEDCGAPYVLDRVACRCRCGLGCPERRQPNADCTGCVCAPQNCATFPGYIGLELNPSDCRCHCPAGRIFDTQHYPEFLWFCCPPGTKEFYCETAPYTNAGPCECVPA